jgi:hypothetical protein
MEKASKEATTITKTRAPGLFGILFRSGVNASIKILLAILLGDNAAKHSGKFRYRVTEWLTSMMIGPKCPECNGKLMIKSGRFGKFYGCSKYPQCHHTEKLV